MLSVHREGRAPPPRSAAAPLPPELLRAYIAAAKQHSPHVPSTLTDYVAAVYAEMRAEEVAADVPHTYTTARTLLSILRLSQALARLRFADVVEQVMGRWGGGEREGAGVGGRAPALRLLPLLPCTPSAPPPHTHPHPPTHPLVQADPQFDVDEALRLLSTPPPHTPPPPPPALAG